MRDALFYTEACAFQTCIMFLYVWTQISTRDSSTRQSYMYGRAATIYGGSNEVQRNVIAKAVLGLE